MNLQTLARPALTGLALLAAASAALAQMPKVEMALYCDAGTGVVRRLDLQTGRYFGAIGAGKLLNPRELAVDGKTGVVYVLDALAIKKFNVSTGRFLGAIRPAATFGNPDDIVVEADGSVDVIQDLTLTTYRIERYNPTTGALLGQSAPRSHDANAHETLTVDAAGFPEVWISRSGQGRVERYNRQLAFLNATGLQHLPYKAVRTRSGGFVYSTITDGIFHTDVYGGVEAGNESILDSNDLFLRSAAEGANGVMYQTYPSDEQNAGDFEIDAYDTSFGVPFYLGRIHINIPADQSLIDMAVYVRF